jgi:hypothetical protein
MSKGTRTNRSRRSIFRSMGGSDVILFGDRCVRPSYCSQRQPRFPTKTGLKSSISGPFCESTPIGELEFSLSTLQGPGKCASLATEQFRGDERGRNRRAIHGHKRCTSVATPATGTRSATSTRTRGPSSAARTSRNPTCWSRNSRATRRSRGRYAAPPDPEPVGCGLQRPRARQHHQVRRSGTRLALTANAVDATLRLDRPSA